jgi:hypothetical protein
MTVASYIVRTDRIVDLVDKMRKMAPGATWKIVDGALDLLGDGFRHLRHFYYCDDKEGNTIRVYDAGFWDALGGNTAQAREHVILRGKRVGPSNGDLKRRIRALFDDVE